MSANLSQILFAPVADPSRLENPVSGEITRALGHYLIEKEELPDQAAFDRLERQSLSIVKHCKSFDQTAGRRTGLAIGHVQSGKTMSMMTVAALARDNGCRLIIILAGVTDILLKQTRDRFADYLQASCPRPDTWLTLDTQVQLDVDRDIPLLREAAAEWSDSSFPEHFQRYVFITAMKHRTHIENLRYLLERSGVGTHPCLIIDDEADQASLNTKPRGRVPSTTYSTIRALRQTLTNHTYLQYTATPQAPLLINIRDELSPDFANVLEPGTGYTGGAVFFASSSPYVVPIPLDELHVTGNIPTDPPESLLNAMRLYFVGTTASSLRADKGPRSMLVHPSQLILDHSAFRDIVARVKDGWAHDLKVDQADPDYEGIIAGFKDAYRELAKTCDTLPEFDREFVSALRIVMNRTIVSLVNSEDGQEVPWKNSYSHILVGGDKLNRGYTVKGLTVTYMPRSGGGFNSDTLQQRARFFGYKERYLGFCRVFLDPEVLNAFRWYVDSELDIRSQLKAFEGRPLREWYRAFILDETMRPTRPNVLSNAIVRARANDTWFVQKHPHFDEQFRTENVRLIQNFLERCDMHGSAEFPQHRIAIVPLQRLLDELLLDFRMGMRKDADGFDSLQYQVGLILKENPKAESQVVLINSGEIRERHANEDNGEIKLHEGRRSSKGPGAYPGDAAVRDVERVTVQIHTLNVDNIQPVYALAINVPSGFGDSDFVLQPDNSIAGTREL